jgi:predicted metal-dependent hydrolase
MSSNKYIDSTIVLDNNVYHYKLAYSNRRSLSMSVNKNREIVVRTNKRFGKEALEKFIKKNIGKMYKRMQERKTNYIVDINNFIIIDEKKYILVYKISNNNKYIKKNDTYCIYYTNLKNRIKILKSLYDKLMCATLAKLNKLIL